MFATVFRRVLTALRLFRKIKIKLEVSNNKKVYCMNKMICRWCGKEYGRSECAEPFKYCSNRCRTAAEAARRDKEVARRIEEANITPFQKKIRGCVRWIVIIIIIIIFIAYCSEQIKEQKEKTKIENVNE